MVALYIKTDSDFRSKTGGGARDLQFPLGLLRVPATFFGASSVADYTSGLRLKVAGTGPGWLEQRDVDLEMADIISKN
jgi:hypothetical protein